MGKMGRRIAIAFTIILAAAAGAAIYFSFFRYDPVVKVTAAVVAPVSETVYGSGTVEPVQWAKVVPLERRRLVKLCRCEGLSVKKDQVLGQQDDAQERSQLDELTVRHDQLVRDLQRAEDDHKHNKISDAEYEQRQTAVNESQSRIAAQKSRLDALVLRAPMDGMVLRRDGEVGEIAGPTEVLFRVGNPSPLQVTAEINEEEITKIAVGQAAYLANEAFPGQALRASVSQITPQGDPTKKTFRVYLLLPADTPLRIGMTVEINVVFREKADAILVPNEAVVNNAIEVVEEGRIRRVPVSLGIHGSRAVEVIGDVSPGALVVTPARMDLKSGSRVRSDTPTRVASDPTISSARPASEVNANPASSGPLDLAAKSVDIAISSALTAHIQSIVGDARKAASNTDAR
jgi:RND family efflux transporter MFP subunit